MGELYPEAKTEPARPIGGAVAAGDSTPVGMGPAEAYCDAVRTVYEKLANLKPNLRLAAITAVTELLALGD